MTTTFGGWMRRVLAAGSILLAVMQVQAVPLYFAPAAADTDLSWANAEGWKLDEGQNDFVHRIPTEEDDVRLNAARIALAGNGIESPHALLITNGVKAVAKSIRIASADSASSASYAKSGRVIGVRIEAVKEGAEDYEYLALLAEKAARLKKEGMDVSAIERLLAEAPERVLGDAAFTVSHGRKRNDPRYDWDFPNRRGNADQVRLEILDALER